MCGNFLSMCGNFLSDLHMWTLVHNSFWPHATKTDLVKSLDIYRKFHFSPGPLQVQFLSAFINRPVIMDCEFLNRFSYTGRLNPCSCADGHTYGTSVNIMWTNHANDGSGRVNHVIPVYYMRGNFIYLSCHLLANTILP